MKIRLHIERLVLDGLPVATRDGPLVRAAVERELTRLLEERGISGTLRAGTTLPRVRASSVRLAPEMRAAQLGHQIARSVFTGIGRAE